MGNFEIGGFLHLKSEIRNLKSDSASVPGGAVQSKISDFGFEMQESPNFKILFLFFCLVLIPVSGFAQVNLAGVWDNLGILHEDWPDRLFGPELGDYGGIPLTDAARLRADTWNASLISLPEYQCRVHPSDYVPSFAGFRVWEERDSASQQLIAIHT